MTNYLITQLSNCELGMMDIKLVLVANGKDLWRFAAKAMLIFEIIN